MALSYHLALQNFRGTARSKLHPIRNHMTQKGKFTMVEVRSDAPSVTRLTGQRMLDSSVQKSIAMMSWHGDL